MNKKLSTIALSASVVVFSAGLCFASPPPSPPGGGDETAQFEQNQNQAYEGLSSVTPGNGFVMHGGDQNQWVNGSVSGGGSGFAEQSQEQAHEYGGMAGGLNNWVGVSGGSEMASDMSGKAKGFGSLSAFGYQDYDAMVSVINFGPNFAVSSMGDDFNQGIGGSAHGLAGVHNSVDLSAENSYAQFAVSPGGDWMFQSGESFTNSSLEGGAVLFGNYGGSVGGSQYGVTITNQDPTSQSGIQAASAKLNGGTYDNGLAIANLSAAMGQTHSYEQVNVNSNGYQHQTGTVTTNVSVQSGYPHP